ncbi:hypothetical protein SAMN04487770_12371 [Butyrivibrio sp. ob235]|uniref:hypothetical protein n=1 Tax=Butyrivibrio sp. ob235 TaxID=1761780 RepID=UPI0008CC0CBB|nr:hypothetical protein [Butyrivibrio sp. ob235]SEM02093.1 hypothetical protein SAMN04487770_12371 [Butyrivibrio sp. ob235]
MTKDDIINSLKEKYKDSFGKKRDDSYLNSKCFAEYGHFVSTIIERFDDADISARDCIDCISTLEIICLDRVNKYFDFEVIDTVNEKKDYKNQKEEYIGRLTECIDAVVGLRDSFVDFNVLLMVKEVLEVARTLDEEENETLKERLEKLRSRVAAGETIVSTRDEDDPNEQWIDRIGCSVRIAKKLLDIMGEELVPEVAIALGKVESTVQ